MRIELTTKLPLQNGTLDRDGYAVAPILSYLDALITPKGSVINEPEYGTEFYKLKHRAFNNEWLIDFKRCLKDATKFDKRLVFIGSTMEYEPEEQRVKFAVKVGVDLVEGYVYV